MSALSHVLAALAIASATTVYGADIFALLVLRPALKHLDEHALTATMGHIHRYGDRRMPIGFGVGLLAAVLAAAAAAFAGRSVAAATSGVAVLALLAWLAVYVRFAAPVNRTLTAAASSRSTATEARQLQRRWDRVLPARAGLQLIALAALCIALSVD